MNIDSIDSDFIRKCIPNVMFEVEGEQPIHEKLAPFIDNARLWLESEYLGHEDFLNDKHNSIAQYIVVMKAFADAVPSLDIVVTPTGFGVVNTETIAPASKERIERLVESLRCRVDNVIDYLIQCARTYPEWRASERGSYFCSSFLSSPRDVKLTGADSYDNMRSFAIQAESFIATHFLGSILMKRLRDEFNAGNTIIFLELHSAVRSVVIKCVKQRVQNMALTQNDVWNLCQHVFHLLRNNQQYFDLWHEEMGHLFDNMKFNNDIKGSYFF